MRRIASHSSGFGAVAIVSRGTIFLFRLSSEHLFLLRFQCATLAERSICGHPFRTFQLWTIQAGHPLVNAVPVDKTSVPRKDLRCQTQIFQKLKSLWSQHNWFGKWLQFVGIDYDFLSTIQIQLWFWVFEKNLCWDITVNTFLRTTLKSQFVDTSYPFSLNNQKTQ